MKNKSKTFHSTFLYLTYKAFVIIPLRLWNFNFEFSTLSVLDMISALRKSKESLNQIKENIFMSI